MVNKGVKRLPVLIDHDVLTDVSALLRLSDRAAERPVEAFSKTDAVIKDGDK